MIQMHRVWHAACYGDVDCNNQTGVSHMGTIRENLETVFVAVSFAESNEPQEAVLQMQRLEGRKQDSAKKRKAAAKRPQSRAE